jgi:hypothetical protein
LIAIARSTATVIGSNRVIQGHVVRQVVVGKETIHRIVREAKFYERVLDIYCKYIGYLGKSFQARSAYECRCHCT